MSIVLGSYQHTHISTGTTTQVKTGSGVLHTIVVNGTAAATVSVYDEVGSDTTNVIAVLKASVGEGTYLYDCVFTRGLKIVTAGASDLTINYY